MKKINQIFALLAIMILPLVQLNASNPDVEKSRQFDYYFMEANKFKIKGDLQKAAEMYQNCIQINQNSAISHFELGKILLLAGDNKNGILLLQKASDLNPKNEWYLSTIADYYNASKDYEKAISTYYKLKELNSEKLEYYYHIIEIHTILEQYKEAISALDEIAILEGQEEYIVLEKQRLYLLDGQQKKSIKEVKKLIAKNPKDSKYHILLGDIYVRTETFTKAKKSYDKASKIDPENGYINLSLTVYYELVGDNNRSHEEMLKAFSRENITYQQKYQILNQYFKLIEKNKSIISEVDELTSTLIKHYPEEAATYFLYANLYMYTVDSTKNDFIIDNLRKCIELDASNEIAWQQLINYYFMNNDFDNVLKYSKQALENGISNPNLYFAKGMVFTYKGEDENARLAFENALEIVEDKDPLKASLYGNLGDIYCQQENIQKGFENYEASLALNYHNTLVLNNYAFYLSEKDTLLEKAETMSAKCIELEPGNSIYLDTYAWILYKRGSFLLAKFYMEQAINNIKEKNPLFYEHYADILWKNNEKEKARIYWQKAIELGGNKNELKYKLERK